MIIKTFFPGILLGTILLFSNNASAGWFDDLMGKVETVKEETLNTGDINKETLSKVLSNEDIANGLKQAIVSSEKGK